MALKLAILVPRRSDKGPRDRLWKFTQPYWEGLEAPIFEGEHLEGPFNRSAAVNAAAREAGSWDVALVLDSDVLVNLQVVKAAVQIASELGRVTFPFRAWKGLSPNFTESVMNGFSGNWDPGVKWTFWDNKSACMVVPRKAWESVGGFDERFEGWGWEDVAFSVSTDTMAGNHVRIQGDLWHLWHPLSTERNPDSPFLERNKRMAHEYIAARHSREEMKAILSSSGGPLS